MKNLEIEQNFEKEVIVISKNYQEEWKKRLKKIGKKCEEKILVSGVVICKNEEANISSCIDSMINAEIDEIVIVDTGSEDKTIELVLQYANHYSNISLYEYQWKDNFALARNFGIEHTQYDWVFFLDADERIINSENRKIQKLISKFYEICEDKVAISPIIINSKANKIYSNPRIFNKKQGFRYYGNVHEMLRSTRESYNPVPFICLNIEIEHRGYISPIIHKKIERNMELIEKAIKEESMNPIWYCYKLRDGRDILLYEEKLKIYQRIREICIPKLEDSFFQYCYDWAIYLVLLDIISKKNLKLSEKVLEEMQRYGACCKEDVFYLESLVKLLKMDQDLVRMEKECIQIQENADFSLSIINTEGYHIEDLKMKIFEKAHKMGEYYKLKEFLFSKGYIQEID